MSIGEKLSVNSVISEDFLFEFAGMHDGFEDHLLAEFLFLDLEKAVIPRFAEEAGHEAAVLHFRGVGTVVVDDE